MGEPPAAHRVVLLVAGAGIIASAVAFLWTRDVARARLSDEFGQRGRAAWRLIQREVDRDAEILRSVGNFFAASRLVERDEFRRFTERAVAERRGIEALAWAPRVAGGDRAALEAAVRAEGIEGFAIVDSTAAGGVVPAPPRAVHHPVLFETRKERSAPLLGLDLAGIADVAEAIRAARERGRLTAVRPTRSGLLRPGSLLLLLPFYRGGGVPATIEERRARFEGIALSVNSIEELTREAIDETTAASVSVCVLERPGDPACLFEIPAGAGPPDRIRAGVYWEGPIDLGGMGWTALFDPTGSFLAEHDRPTGWVALAAGLLLTFLAALAAHRGALRYRAEQALRETEERLRLAIESVPAIVWGTDADLVIAFSEGAGLALLNLRPGQLTGTPLPAYLGTGPEVAPALDAHRRALAGESVDFDQAWGGRVWHSRVEPLRDDGGRVVGTIGFAFDITDRKRAEEDLAAAVRARDVFLSIASHEMKTPLAALLLQIESIGRTLARSPAPTDLREKFSVVERQAERLGRLADTLLDVSRISAGGLDLRREPVDLVEIARGTAERGAAALVRAGCAVEWDVAGPVTGRWDRLRLEQVVANLLSNAATHAPGRPIRIEVRAEGPTARLTVRDGGPGIPPEAHERIFRRFEKVGGDRARGGLGLGLYIAREIVVAHGGTIQVESAPGKGAAFHVRLPREEGGAPPSPAGGARAARARRVLVVEDDEAIRDLLVQILRDEGYRAEAVPCGREALDRLRRAPPPDLVLLDMILPEVDGWAVLEGLRGDPALASIPVVAISAAGRVGDRARAAGAAEFLPKPIRADDLLQAVARHCRPT